VRRFGEGLQVQLQQQQVSVFGLDISWLGFGLSDHLFCDALSLGRDALLFVWLSSLGFASGGILRSRLRCSEGGFGLWLGDEGIVVVKRAHHLIYSNRLWARTPSVNLKCWKET
jgi:hypothetical protein